jgi:hypothetical protein
VNDVGERPAGHEHVHPDETRVDLHEPGDVTVGVGDQVQGQRVAVPHFI